MNIIHATWEKRNFGVESYKMSIDDSDTWESIVAEEKEVYGDYLVIKVPTYRRDISFRLNEIGYSYADTNFFCHYDCNRELHVPPLSERFIKQMSFCEMQQDETHKMYEIVKQGLFVNDTVGADPYYSVEIGGKRCCGMIYDAVERGAKIYKHLYRDNIIGFAVMSKSQSGNMTGVIAGIYPKYQNAGFGVPQHYWLINEAKKNNARYYYSSFTSNNHNSNALHMFLGYTLDRSEYIFVKHNKVRE